MHLRSVSAAARIGLSLEPFSSERINVVRNSDGVLHFDDWCGYSGTADPLCVRLDEIHLHRHCPTCLRPYSFPAHVEAYGRAADELQQAKWQTNELIELRGMALARGAHSVRSACRRALHEVSQQTSSIVGLIEKSCSTIRRQIPALGSGEELENYLYWAAALVTQPDDFFTSELRAGEHWRRQFEYARGEIRGRGLDGLAQEMGRDSEIVAYCEKIRAVREHSSWSVVAVKDGAAEGTMLLELCARYPQERREELYALCPDWAVEASRLLGGEVNVVGPAESDEAELVAMYADLARTRPGPESLDAARRLVRGSRRRS